MGYFSTKLPLEIVRFRGVRTVLNRGRRNESMDHDLHRLGHADRRTTLNHYTGATDARQRRKAGRVRYG